MSMDNSRAFPITVYGFETATAAAVSIASIVSPARFLLPFTVLKLHHQVVVVIE